MYSDTEIGHILSLYGFPITVVQQRVLLFLPGITGAEVLLLV